MGEEDITAVVEGIGTVDTVGEGIGTVVNSDLDWEEIRRVWEEIRGVWREAWRRQSW